MGYSKSSSKREVYSNKILPQETRKTSNRQFNFTPTPSLGERFCIEIYANKFNLLYRPKFNYPQVPGTIFFSKVSLCCFYL